MRNLGAVSAAAIFVTLAVAMYGLTQADVGLGQALFLAPMFLGLLVLFVRMSGGGTPAMVQLVVAAALVRIAAAALFQYVPQVENVFALDAQTYDAVGVAWSEFWKGTGTPLPARFSMVYYLMVGAEYYLFGHAPLLPKVTNAVIGAAGVFYTFRIGWALFGEETGWRAATLVAFFPSLILWSAMNIRDAPAILAVLAIVWHTISLKSRFSVGSAVMVVASLWLVGSLREYLFPLMGAAIILGLFLSDLRSAPRNIIAVAVLALVFVMIYRQTSMGGKFVNEASFEELQKLRQGGMIGARTAYMQDVDISTPTGAIMFLPLGVAYFLLSPFPWQIGGARHLLPLPEMLYWYSLVPMVLYGGRRLLKENFSTAVVVVMSIIVLTIGYGLGSSNIGTAYRHRGQVMPLLLTLAAAGLVVRDQERRRMLAVEQASSPPEPFGRRAPAVRAVGEA